MFLLMLIGAGAGATDNHSREGGEEGPKGHQDHGKRRNAQPKGHSSELPSSIHSTVMSPVYNYYVNVVTAVMLSFCNNHFALFLMTELDMSYKYSSGPTSATGRVFFFARMDNMYTYR